MSDLRDRTLEILSQLVGFPTVTSDSNLPLIDYCMGLLAKDGIAATITTDETGAKANLFATIGPPIDGGVILSGHTDVVPADGDSWDSPPFVAHERDGRVYGRGAVDMKGFIACVLALAPRAAQARLTRPIHLALTYDEEVGCLGAPVLLDELSRSGLRPGAAIVGEPTSMAVITAHKGCFEYTTSIAGRAGHGSAPGQAVNAVEYAARYIDRLLELRAELAARAPHPGVFSPPESTISVGRIEGGTARNVVAGACGVEWEFRPVSQADAQLVHTEVAALEARLLDAMRAVEPLASITTVTEGAVDGLEDDPGSAATALCQRLLGDAVVDVVSFSTEAGLFQRAGIPAVVCGPGSIEVAHRPNEFIELEQIDRCLDMLEGLISECSDAGEGAHGNADGGPGG